MNSGGSLEVPSTRFCMASCKSSPRCSSGVLDCVTSLSTSIALYLRGHVSKFLSLLYDQLNAFVGIAGAGGINGLFGRVAGWIIWLPCYALFFVAFGTV